jgi:RNA polymerase sigma factor (sigma-70 family)
VTADPFAVDPGDYAEVCEVVEAVGSLPARQREMLRLSVGGLTGAEIARAFGCSEARASQLLTRARVEVEERTAA